MSHSPSRITAVLSSTTSPSGQSLSERSSSASLTRVSLVFVEQRVNLYLRFGHPQREQRVDRRQRYAFFLPGARFARILWQANDYGTTRWQLLVLQACTPQDSMQRIPGIHPGACILLHVEGESRMRRVLAQIDAIETLGIDPTDVSPAYWHTLSNRLTARRPLPVYTAERHAAWLAVCGLS